MRHQDLTINHVLESWVFANKAAREAAGPPYVSGDLGRIGYQSDTGEYYRLLNTASGSTGWATIALPTTAKYQGAGQNPPGNNAVTPGTMCGLGTATYGTATITPTRSGKVFIIGNGNLSTDTANCGMQCVLAYGTGTAPNNGAAQTGTSLGTSVAIRHSGLAANLSVPFCTSGIVSLTVGTTYWLDFVQIRTGSTGLVVAVFCAIQAFELP